MHDPLHLCAQDLATLAESLLFFESDFPAIPHVANRTIGRAVNVLALAAALGHARAQFHLGAMLGIGALGVRTDLAAAASLVSAAARAGVPEAAMTMG